MKEALSKVPKDSWKEFSAFAGPRLNELHAWNKLVLIGDASHPLTGKTVENRPEKGERADLMDRRIWIRCSIRNGRWLDSCAKY